LKTQRKKSALVCWLITVCLAAAMGVPSAWAEQGNAKGGGLAVRQGAQPPTAAQTGGDQGQNDDFDLLDEGQEMKPAVTHVADPLAPWNRIMFKFNDKMYFWVLKPVARGYNAVVPTFFRDCIQNFFTNLGTPVRMANCILQAKGEAAIAELAKCLTNSTIGVLGFGNPARHFPALNPDGEDLGQTLGRYGIGQGIYLVWPLLGPSTLRDSLGLAGDYFLEPTSYIHPFAASLGVDSVQKVNKTSLQLGQYEAFKASAIEPYSAARDAYLQYRQGKVEK
jgi:phospholipid-binding lipoprotein MlaA